MSVVNNEPRRAAMKKALGIIYEIVCKKSAIHGFKADLLKGTEAAFLNMTEREMIDLTNGMKAARRGTIEYTNEEYMVAALDVVRSVIGYCYIDGYTISRRFRTMSKGQIKRLDKGFSAMKDPCGSDAEVEEGEDDGEEPSDESEEESGDGAEAPHKDD